ncbi:CotH family protein, partial [gut metagenome]
MKYKLWGTFLCICVILLSLIAPVFENSGSPERYHQHLEAPLKAVQTKGSGFSSHLPLVILDTNGVEIPGKTVKYPDGTHTYTTAADGSSFITAHMDIVDQETAYNHPEDTPTLSSTITIHVRGNSSRAFDKPSYSIRLI